MKFSSIGIIGYGGMGQLIQNAAADYLTSSYIRVYDSNIKAPNTAEEAMSSDLIVFCVNDDNLEACLQSVENFVRKDAIYVTISAIMTHSLNCIKSLPSDLKFLITHPLFGPASYRNKGQNFNDFRIAITNHSLSTDEYKQACNFLNNLGLQIVDTSPAEHDESSARDHFIPYLLSHLLKDLSVGQSAIKTYSVSQLITFLECTSYSKSQLKAMYKYNPYVKQIINSLNICLEDTIKELQK